MKNSLKNKVITVCFALFLGGLAIASLVLPDTDIIESERRKAAQLPEFSSENLLSGKLFTDFESYLLDQFPLRDGFRTLNAVFRQQVLGQLDNNGIYIVNGSICKIEYPLKESSVQSFAGKLNAIRDKYLADNRVFCSVIPDKNYYTAAQSGHLALDYERMMEILLDGLSEKILYVDIFDCLNADSYYLTDLHWKQQSISTVAERLLGTLSGDFEKQSYTVNTLEGFYGGYYGQSAIKAPAERLEYLTSGLLENCTVYDYEDMTEKEVYCLDEYIGNDPYDVFLSGATPLIEIKNPEGPEGRELVIFRDSFSSSLAPLLVSEYSKITLVDIRYMTTDSVGDYIDFSRGQDVLFLYNTMIINNSTMLK